MKEQFKGFLKQLFQSMITKMGMVDIFEPA